MKNGAVLPARLVKFSYPSLGVLTNGEVKIYTSHVE